MQFYIVDVFTEKKYAGNQLAVIREAASLTTETMQAIALEMNYSETTFILGDASRDGGYDVRIFTPAEEIPFAGHPTLGTAFIIQQKIIQSPIEKVILNLKVGQIPVTFSYQDQQPSELWMHQRPPDFGETFTPDTLAAVLNLNIEDIDPRFPIQDVSTGLPFIIVPLQSLSATKRCRVNLDRFEQLIKTSQRARAVFVFCAETYQTENRLNARMFSPYYSVAEDPATGSANGCLAGYLVKHRYFGSDDIDVRVEQGYEIRRPSLLKLKAQAHDDHIDVFVGGGVVLTAEGQLV
ncbi:MAG: PhzF family phenazine biosynthesis protein [Anaerolineaceae bacterium]|nr:PhzF family phenazine biosynthesis protein [Anaerolineaceae bacterium]MCB9097974.1 PhzF family phenazine biosynthesis protein [Anaerolineales bacterium]